MFKNVNTAAKIISLVALMAVFMGAIGLTGYYFNKKANTALDSMYADRLLPVQWLNEARAHARVIQLRGVELMLLDPDSTAQQKALADIQARREKFNSLMADYEKTKLDAHEKERLTIFKEYIATYRQGFQRAQEMAATEDRQEAFAYYQAHAADALEKANEVLIELAEYKGQAARDLALQNARAASAANSLMLIILAGGVALTLFAGVWVGRLIANPLRAILANVQSVAAGNLNVEPLATGAQDEVGRLGAAFNEMVVNLRKLILQVQQSAEQVAAASEQLTASAEQSARAAEQIAATITGVAGGADKQLSAVTSAITVVDGMSESVEQMALNSMEVTTGAEQAANAALEGGEAIEQAIGKMADIEKTVNLSAEMVAELGMRSQEIGQIVATISGIAGQTNLLALNAAIEAARAGEQGRGFAVVAEEVRKLAEQSQDAAKQIADLIGSIQSDTGKAVAAMSDGTREVTEGSAVVNTAGETFRNIVGLVQQVSEQTKASAAAIEQIADGSLQIVDAVHAVDEISRNTSAETQTVSAATEEQSATLQEVASSSMALAKLAEDMQLAVNQFKL
ncbi:MAG TPA: methyl-accepting chemotaxis protein [Negativicutes bacterium]|nr:methyl-accepting chemotaxis protein [Negativicutes bacterium]